jgi:pilus assembly protein FimV
MAELSREFDLPQLPGAPTNAAAASEPEDPLFDLDAMNFDLPATADPVPALAPAAAPATPAAASAELNDPLFDLDAMDFGLPETPAQDAGAGDDPFAPGHSAANPLPRFDMSGIDLDLPPAQADDEPLPLPEVDRAGAGEMSAAHMEMETKLDLAIAYQEIGDKEGARELLDEVIKGGSSEQVSKASAMRTQLA